MRNVYLYSAKTLQEWNPETPFITGIGGSETAHIEMHKCLKNLNIPVTSFAPIGNVLPFYEHWWDNAGFSQKSLSSKPGILINYRDFALYDKVKFKKNIKHWFVAQDVSYPFTESGLAKIDRYICLCQEHAKHTVSMYPQMRDKIYISSNGVRGEMISELYKTRPERNPNRLFYASSPDRGLVLLLQQWFRIRERVPGAELKIAYGLDNLNKIIELSGGSEFHENLRAQLLPLFDQPGVEWLGRLPQDKVFQNWFEANVFPYGSDFPETSCISIMEAQACGAVPVTTNFWAQGENVNIIYGERIDGIPQRNSLTRAIYIERIIEELQYPLQENLRRELSNWAIDRFSWTKIAEQWNNWIKEDSK